MELFDATVKENIARMAEGDSEGVVAAVSLAGVHELFLRLPKGYDTEIGNGRLVLSSGQRQRLALARAVYGEPSFIVLDEPNSNLDQLGVSALLKTISTLKERGVTLVLVAHQPSLVRQVDYLMVLGDGVVQMAGPREAIINKVTRNHG